MLTRTSESQFTASGTLRSLRYRRLDHRNNRYRRCRLGLCASRFANRAMATQRVRSQYALEVRRGKVVTVEQFDVLRNRSWRPFQLAFLLLSIPSLADPLHPDRVQPVDAYADLLWFPTGGGKTEAYLGVAAFTMAIRRMQGNLGGYDGSRGLAVIMRYTLRLLTLQQFQRATALICAMEVLRREALAAGDRSLGAEPFTHTRRGAFWGVDKKHGPRRPVITNELAEWTGLEPATPGVTGRYSNQLNYHSVGVRQVFDYSMGMLAYRCSGGPARRQARRLRRRWVEPRTLRHQEIHREGQCGCTLATRQANRRLALQLRR